jgi:aspartyl-tRNA synthetase
MSFVEEDDVLNLIEELYTKIIETLFPDKWIIRPFPRMTYAEAMASYGSDKPDLRFNLDMADLSDIASQTEFRVFTSVVASGGIVKGFSAPGCATMPRRQQDALIDFARANGAQGLVTIALTGEDDIHDLTEEGFRSPAARFLTVEQVKAIAHRIEADMGDMILIVAGPDKTTNQALSALRNEMAKRLELADPNLIAFAFVTDFPLFEWNEDDERWDAMHHAFSMPKDGHEAYLNTDPGKVLGKLYDLVANGEELASGSIRIHNRELQERVFGVLGYTKEQVAERFDQLLTAFEYGTPPHGGIAPGIDRLLMVLTGRDNIRDVIAFPKTQSGFDPLFEAPNSVERYHLDELHISVDADNPTDVG